MTYVTIPNRPGGSDVRAVEQLIADFDAITAVINGNLDVSNFTNNPQTIMQKPYAMITTQDPGLTSTVPTLPPHPARAVLVMTVAGAVQIGVRAVATKTSGGGNLFCGLYLDGNLVPAANFNTAGGPQYVMAGAGAASGAPAYILYTTGDLPQGLRVIGINTTDWPQAGAAAQMLCSPVELWVPSGTHTFDLRYWLDAAGSYTVENQFIVART